jgi:hypothetical protein
VDNHADGPFVYLELLKEDPERAPKVMQLLQWNQGNSSGDGIGCISWDGEVYADQFWRHFSFGNVKDRPFSEIWSDVSRTTPESELMYRLKDKRPWVTGAAMIAAGSISAAATSACAPKRRYRRPVGQRPGVLPDRRGDRPASRRPRDARRGGAGVRERDARITIRRPDNHELRNIPCIPPAPHARERDGCASSFARPSFPQRISSTRCS